MSLLKLLTQEQCPQCHSPVGNDQRCCPACGAETARAWRLCPHCSASVSADAQHCWSCGAQTPVAPGAVTFSHRWQRPPQYFAVRETLASPQERLRSGLLVDPDVAAAIYQDGRFLCELAPGYHSASVFAPQGTAGSMEVMVVTRTPERVLLHLHVCVTPADGLATAVEVQAHISLALADLPLFVRYMLQTSKSVLKPEDLVPLVSRHMEGILQEICCRMDARMLLEMSRHPEFIREKCLQELDKRLADCGLRCDRFQTFSFHCQMDDLQKRVARRDGSVQVAIQHAELDISKLLFADEESADMAMLAQVRKAQLGSMDKLRALKEASSSSGSVAPALTGLQESQPAPAAASLPAAGEPPESNHFTAAMPRSVSAEDPFEVVVWMHLAQQLESVKSLAASHHGEASPALKTKAGVQVVRGSTLTVSLSVDVPGAQVHPAQEELLWQGEITNACFTVLLGAAAPKGAVTAQCNIHCNGLKIAGLAFVISVEGKTSQAPGFVEIKPYGKAFASYASEDRDAVLARIQGMQKVRPDLDVFLDVARLRSNQDWKSGLQEAITQCDVLYLFWSAAAARSHWVDWEWRYALQQKGDPGVDPVPLVSPRLVGPPQELRAKHFDEWMLAYMSGQNDQPPAERPEE